MRSRKNMVRKILSIFLPVFLSVVINPKVSAYPAQNEKLGLKYRAVMDDKLPDGVIFTEPSKNIKGHKLVAESDNYQLYFKEDSLSVIVRDKTTGAIMESVVEGDVRGNAIAGWQSFLKSGIVLKLIKGINLNHVVVGADEAERDVKLTGDGFYAKLYYEEYGIGFDVHVSLSEDQLIVEIPNRSIVEDKDEYKIGEIYVYPFLGHTHMGDRSGYMLVPDGNGAMIYLNDKNRRFSSNYSQYVYGRNIGIDEPYALSLLMNRYQSVNEAENIMAPVFGMVHTDSEMGYLGIIESGDYSAKIEAYPNGAYTDYNWICSKFILRQIYIQPTGKREGHVIARQERRNEFDIRVRYCFVSGEYANYTGLALKYRDFLLKHGIVVPRHDNFRIRLDFLGIDKENWLIFKRNVTMTTVNNIKEIYKELKDAGVTDIISVYKGWQKDGINALPIEKYAADGDIGGNGKLTALIRECESSGIEFYLYQDSLRINPSIKNAAFNVVKQITKRVYEEMTYKDVFEKFRFLTPAKTRQVMIRSAKSYINNGVTNIMLGGITNILFTYTHKGNLYTRVDTANIYESAVSELSGKLNFIMEKPFSYLWKYTNAIADMPISTSNYIFTDEEVPFLTIALKGLIPMYSEYVNFEANKEEFFLKLVETGVYPSFYITYEDPAKLQYTNSSDIYSSRFAVYKDDIIRYYNELKKINDLTQGAKIISHSQFSNGLTVVSYDNGVKIYLNYNPDRVITADGYAIEPMSYVVGGGK
ncbi:hypothetical protein Cst_c11200 [Thermoclostridium stercorarium subsp. stercorarium DSM 8532]|uniref:Uncharacterized protein n=3 Tax=Thermoclostridium stercorarium TaxID=1510 RepID=L7VNT3_THES1|nr:DUF5696 domain-containing protein [Thermoclostridium stercorarium]AGC68116.1 hypothetical protein Cst_c11200 [Thermoclostridium stercorarium subsp. stercorarium DSM 8532]AGI39142.1 hypothetical protein Clst_1072 [Thermoclostridium stercorarium subsp. stercorarium DSM 8532]ANW98497.1 hypothetical protein CSTERTH_05300 [Thermoclostridium stercorarium subsp. thermolacticum DSM 2910]